MNNLSLIPQKPKVISLQGEMKNLEVKKKHMLKKQYTDWWRLDTGLRRASPHVLLIQISDGRRECVWRTRITSDDFCHYAPLIPQVMISLHTSTLKSHMNTKLCTNYKCEFVTVSFWGEGGSVSWRCVRLGGESWRSVTLGGVSFKCISVCGGCHVKVYQFGGQVSWRSVNWRCVMSVEGVSFWGVLVEGASVWGCVNWRFVRWGCQLKVCHFGGLMVYVYL